MANGRDHSNRQQLLWKDELSVYESQSIILHNWDVESFLDKGTFSRIFLVKNRRTGVHAALKFVPNPMDLADCRGWGSAEESFYRMRYEASKKEAEIMTRFHGEQHVVQYLEKPEYLMRSFENEHGEQVVSYAVLICMPLYRNYREWMPKVVASRDLRLKLGLDIANALMAFEKNGVFHRDIKPGNILQDAAGNFCLGDVGEAKLESEFTTTGFHGTRPYMAPEVYNQEKESSKMRSDHRSDIYSLGIILYRLFNHQQFPFLTEGGTLTDEATESYRRYKSQNQLEEEDAYLNDGERARLLRYDGLTLPLPKEADAQLAQVILKACAYTREERWQTAKELHDALLCCAEGKPLPVPIALPVKGKAEAKKRALTNAAAASASKEEDTVNRADSLRTEGKPAGGKKKSKGMVIAIGAAAMALVIAGTGFMFAGRFKREVAPVPTFAAVPSSTPTQAPTAAPTSTPTQAPTATPTPTSTPAPTPTPTAAPTATPMPLSGHACTAEAFVQLRANPSENAMIQSVLREKGAVVEIMKRVESEGKVWYLVEYEGEVGYAYTQDLREMTEDEVRAYTATPTPTPTTTPTAKPTATPTVKPTATPTAKPTATPTAKPTATPTVKPTATPTVKPTATPTAKPTATPTAKPTATPTVKPTVNPAADFKYSVENGQVTITKYTGNATEVAIPAEIEGKPVRGIGSSAFRNCSSLSNITIPDSVTTIGSSAFYNCKSLSSITIPDSVTSIGSYAFYNCKSLSSITIPDSVIFIGSFAFSDCQDIAISAPVGSYAEIYAKKNGIPFKPVSDTSHDAVVTATPTVKPTATPLAASKSLSGSIDGFDYTIKQGAATITGYDGSKTKLTIPRTIEGFPVTRIGSSAFYNRSSLSSITIPDSVTSIEDNAFCDCRSLSNITIPDSVTTIGDSAFYNCRSLSSITIPDSEMSIGAYAFCNCNSLSSITIPDGVTSIGAYAFDSCSSLSSITIPDSVTSIGAYAFKGCPNIILSVAAGSYAETYAKENSIPFKPVSDTSQDAVVTATPTVKPTATPTPTPTPTPTATPTPTPTPAPLISAFDESMSNLADGGMLTSDGSFNYVYRTGSSGPYVTRYDLYWKNGTDVMRGSSYLAYQKDYVYYVCSKTKKGAKSNVIGTETYLGRYHVLSGIEEQFFSLGKVLTYTMDENWIYCVKQNGIYRVALDGSSSEKICSKSFSNKLLSMNTFPIRVYQDWLYFVCDQDNYALFRMPCDGSQKPEKITQDQVRYFTIAQRGSRAEILYSEKKTDSLRGITLKGKPSEQFRHAVGLNAKHFQIRADMLYFSDSANGNKLTSVNLSTGEKRKYSFTTARLFLAGEQVLAFEKDSYKPKLWRIEEDGSLTAESVRF